MNSLRPRQIFSTRALIMTCGLCAAPAGVAMAQSVDIHGFASQGYLYSTDNNFLAHSEGGSAEFNEFALNFSSDLTESLRVGMQIYSRDLGPLDNNKIILDWAYGDYRVNDAFGVRFGRMKTPYGLYNEVLDLDAVRPTAFLPQSVYPLNYRDFLLAFNGAVAYGHLETGPVGSWDYQAGGGYNVLPVDGSLSGTFGQPLSDADNKWTLVAALRWNTPIEGLRLSGTLTGYESRLAFQVPLETRLALQAQGLPADQIPRELALHYDPIFFYVASAEYTVGNLVLAAEYKRWRGDASSSNEMMLPAVTTNLEGFYVQASYRWSDLLETSAYISFDFDDTGDRDGKKREAEGEEDYTAYTREAALAFRFDLNDYWLFKLEGHYLQGTSFLTSQLNNDDPVKNWALFVARTTVTF